MLAEEAHPLENLDRAAAQEALSKAQSEFNSAGNEKVSRYAPHVKCLKSHVPNKQKTIIRIV